MASFAALQEYARNVNLHQKVRENFLRNAQSSLNPNSICLLQNAPDIMLNDTDCEMPYQPDSFFFYLFGVMEESIVGTINLQTGEPRLFLPSIPDQVAPFLATPTPEEFTNQYQIQTLWLDQLQEYIQQQNCEVIYLNKGLNTDSGHDNLTSYYKPEWLSTYNVNQESLFPVLTECRVTKLNEEIEIMRRVCEETANAHREVMRHCKPGIYEYELAGVFQGYHLKLGSLHAYNPIVGSGNNGAILHYPYNRSLIQENQLILMDMGFKGYGYCSDITSTIPSNGIYTEKQKIVYEAVLEAHNNVMEAMKPGVEWKDMHILAETTILQHLIRAGILQGELPEVQAAKLGAVFFPHGLGHFIGLDTHDVGGFNRGACRCGDPGLNKLRTTRVLQENMVITVEPGCYFRDFIIEQALNNENQSAFINRERLEEFRGMGGVRIESVVVVTANGMECLGNLPRTVSEIEEVMSQK